MIPLGMSFRNGKVSNKVSENASLVAQLGKNPPAVQETWV